MFNKTIYQSRRKTLKESVKKGIILIPGNVDVPMNYPANTYHFRQDSNFLYFFGLDQQKLIGIMDIDNDKDYIFGDDVSLDGIIWMGPQPSISERSEKAGVKNTAPYNQAYDFIKKAISEKRTVHFLPQYRAENKLMLEKLLDIRVDELPKNVSTDLIRGVVELRSVKGPEEIAELEKVMETAYEMHTTAMKMAKPGIYEREISGAVEGIALAKGGMLSFPIILTVNGETLHNHYHGNILQDGQMLLVDTGTESELHYASDHTRTFPVSGKFTSKQKDIYNIVLRSQLRAIDAIKPGISFKSIHLLAMEEIASGLRDLELMKGDIKAAVEKGAHALFMPHGLGHMMGLDVHDMEDLGENFVGYDDEVKRADQFGTAFLRLGRKLKAGYVLTVEPGIYFIPALIDKWEKEGLHKEHINYDKVRKFIGFGGVRIEDDILVTENGCRVLGKPIPKTVEEIEEIMKK
ncbi:MAG: aminopeptidase P family protein [Bacteroidetes bacterium]|nr:aminopeptidase P family protein [Bacteroidota bacterium]